MPPGQGVTVAEVRDGVSLHVASAPLNEGLTIWKTSHTFEPIGMLEVGSTVVAAGPAEVVKGYPMVPVRPDGAVDARYLEAALDCVAVTACAEEDANISADSGSYSTSATLAAPRYAYCSVIWGANAGYILGALVLGAKLKEFGGGRFQPDTVLLHTDDVPENYVAMLAKVWTVVKQVDYIDGSESMYLQKGGCFDGVFTKLAAWSFTDYDKVLLLDVDVIPLQSPEDIFDVQAPAAFVRGNGDRPHGEPVDGRSFFIGDLGDEHRQKWAWCQSGGINAGVILLHPCEQTFDMMLAELGSELHPCLLYTSDAADE